MVFSSFVKFCFCFPKGSSRSSFSPSWHEPFASRSLQGLNFFWHYWLRFFFYLTACIISFSKGKDTPCCNSDFIKRCYFWPHVCSLGKWDRCCSGCCAGVSFCRRAGKKFTWVYQAGPDIYSNVFVYPVPCLLQRSLLRILTLKHVTKSALHSGVHYLSQPV